MTFLIRVYWKDSLVFDISGTKEGSKTQQLLNFFGEYLRRAGRDHAPQPPQNWYEAFELLADYLQKLPKTGLKLVVFLDEMPWMDTPKSHFIPALEFFWNQHGSRMDRLVLVACGSASSWIKKNLILARGGLYNRVTHRIKLTPFGLHETELFFQNMGVTLPRYQILELYMAMGGIPFYLKEVEKGKSSTQLVDEICFVPNGLLQHEYGQLYHSLFRNAENHVKIIETLAAHPQGLTHTGLLRATKLAAPTFAKTLDELLECDFIGQFQPLFNKKKDAIFKLTDLYSLFYLNRTRAWRGRCGNSF